MDLVDKMCKYEMDQASAVEDTKQTLNILSTDGWRDEQTGGQMDGWTRWNQYTPTSTYLRGNKTPPIHVSCLWDTTPNNSLQQLQPTAGHTQLDWDNGSSQYRDKIWTKQIARNSTKSAEISIANIW